MNTKLAGMCSHEARDWAHVKKLAGCFARNKQMQLLLQPASRGMLTFSTNKFISHFPVIRFAQKLGSRSIALGAMYMQSFERKGCELHPQQPELKGPVQLKGPVFDCICLRFIEDA